MGAAARQAGCPSAASASAPTTRRINQTTTGGVSGAVALGVPENDVQHDRVLRGSRLHVAPVADVPEGQPDRDREPERHHGNAALYADDYTQVDFSSSFDLGEIWAQRASTGRRSRSTSSTSPRRSSASTSSSSNATFTRVRSGHAPTMLGTAAEVLVAPTGALRRRRATEAPSVALLASVGMRYCSKTMLNAKNTIQRQASRGHHRRRGEACRRLAR